MPDSQMKVTVTRVDKHDDGYTTVHGITDTGEAFVQTFPPTAVVNRVTKPVE